MKILRTTKLWFREGASDKVYEVDLVDSENGSGADRFLVNFRYGRRGGALREGTKTPGPVARAAAEKLFDSVVVAKVNEGYRRLDGAEPTAPAAPIGPDSPTGREQALTAQLEACLREPWPAKQRDRLFWRVGEVKLLAAGPLLARFASERSGYAGASYSLVWALARTGGPGGADALTAIARQSGDALVRGLAEIALMSPLMGERRLPPAPEEPLAEPVSRALANADLDALSGAVIDFAQREPTRVRALLVSLYRLAMGEGQLHGLLAALAARLPVRPPFVPGLRRLFKYAEMLDDGAMFGAVAHRFETAKPMYRNSWGGKGDARQARVPEIHAWKTVQLDHLKGAPDAKTALSRATQDYLKRRIWRALRKRGELGQEAFLDLATGYLLAFTEADLAKPTYRVHVRWEDRQRIVTRQDYGPLSHAWSVGQLLYRESPNVRMSEGSLIHGTTNERLPEGRGEAFRALWDARPEYALRIATESPCEPIALFAVGVLRGQPEFLRALAADALADLLVAPVAAAAALGLEEARTRLAQGAADPDLLAVLLGAALPEARDLAIRRIDAEPAWPFSSITLALLAVSSAYEDVRAAGLRWSGERRPGPEIAYSLAHSVAEWLAVMPDPLPEGEAGRIRHIRACFALLWPGHDLPLTPDVIARLLAHPSPEVVAVGADALSLSGADAASLPEALWQQLLATPVPEVQAAGLGLLSRLSDEQLSERAFLVLSLATSPAAEVRRAARPLIVRLAARFPRIAEDLAQRLVDLLFLAAPDDGFAEDAVALFRQALPKQLAGMDAGLIWRLLQAKAKGAQLLGATAATMREPAIFSVRQLARLGNHSHIAVREWVMAAYEKFPDRIRAEAEDAVLLVESEWPETYEFALAYFERWPAEVWTPNVMGVVADSVNPKVLTFARSVLRRTLRPGDASVQLQRLLEHPATAMHLLITEVLTADAARDDTVFDKLLPLARIVLFQVHKGRVAKDRMSAFLHAEAMNSRERAARILPLFTDLSLSALEKDRTAAVLALRDIGGAHPDLATGSPLKPVAVERRAAS
jgi:hypothetical protein